MTKSELITRVAARCPPALYKDAELAVDSILEALSMRMAQGGRAEIRGFGSFGINWRPSRSGRNPRSGAPVLVPAKYVPHFKPAKRLREGVKSA